MSLATRVISTSLKASIGTLFGMSWMAAGCIHDEAVKLDLAMRAPQGLLDGAKKVTLDVFVEGGGSCNATSGRASGSGEKDSYPLEQSGCATGATWCKTINLPRDESNRVFSVTAADESGTIIAQGCSEAKVDQDPLEVRIDVKPPVVDKCCGDGALQTGEQCDSGINTGAMCGEDTGTGGGTCGGVDLDAVCSCDCIAEEILLSLPSALGSALLTNDPDTKGGLSMAFAGSSGTVAGALRAVFEDGPAGGPPDEINLRLLKPTLHPFPYDEQNQNNPENAYAFQLHPPLCSNVYKHPFASRRQITPAIATISDSHSVIVYASNQTGDLSQFSIYLNAQGPDGCSSGSLAVSESVTTSAEFPDVAPGPDGSTLVVWRDGDELNGRIWTKDGKLSPEDANLSFGKAAPDSRPRIAGTTAGWLLAYTGAGAGDSDGVWLTRLEANGTVNGTDLVNTATDGVQDQPDIAQLPGGQVAVVWRSGGKIFFQRYDASLARVEGDQSEALNPNRDAAVDGARPSAGAPVLAAGSKAAPWFVAAWEADDGTIRSRYIGAESGFGFNSVDGDNRDFIASHPRIETARRDPAVAISDSYIAIGWLDTSNDHPGMYVRRFPLPN